MHSGCFDLAEMERGSNIIAMKPKPLQSPWCLILSVWFAGLAGGGLAQSVDRLEFDSIPGSVVAGEVFPIVIRGVTSGGVVVSNWTSQVRLRSFTPTATLPVISELDSAGEAMEITNPGGLPVDLSGWELQVLSDYGGTTVPPNARLRFPPGTVLPAQSALVWTSVGTPPGGFPKFVSAKRFNSPSSFRLTRIYDSLGRIVDEVYSRASVIAPDDAAWRGVGLGSFPTNVTFQRAGFANHFRNVDWATNLPNLGTTNPGLSLPWSPSGIWVAAAPATIQITNGVGSGAISLPLTASGTTSLQADDGAGIAGMSAAFALLSLPKLELSPSASLLPASEAQAGWAGTITIFVATPPASNLPITLTLSDTNEFAAPAQVVIPSGTNAVVFAVTNFNDAVADGLALVSLTARATGYADGISLLQNADDEAGQLTVIVPALLKEDSGFGPELGRVFLPEPARHDVLIQLSADAPVEVPAAITIPAGRLSQTFSLRVGDDALANPYGWQVGVRASTLNWSAAEASIQITDDEDPGFTNTVPALVVEGPPQSGQIQVKTAHAADTVFTLTSNSPRLLVPAQVVLPAGELTVNFPIQTPDNQQVDAQTTGQLCIQTTGVASQCRQLTLADDEVNLSRLTLGNTAAAYFANQPFGFSARLVDAAGATQRTNANGQVSLLVAPTLAQLTGVTNPIAFVNGAWTNQIAISGEALDVQLAVSALGYQTNSARFDVIPGREVPMLFNDAVWHGGLARFLVAEPAQSNTPARLTEIDPLTGQRGRSLNLARTARRIALADDGSVAWIASTFSTLQRVDVANWLFDREFPIDLTTTNTDPRDLVVLPGAAEKVVAVVNINNTGWRVMLFDHGLGFTNRATLPGTITSVNLTAGRDASEVYCQSFGKLSRFLVGSNAVTLGVSSNLASSSVEWPSLALSNGRLYRGKGVIYDPDTLAPLTTFPTLNSVVGCPFDDQAVAVFLEQNAVLKAYDSLTAVVRGSHSVPASVGTPLRLLRWGTRGLASFTSAGTNLVIFETPLLRTNTPDLAVAVNAPALAVIPTGSGLPASFTWQFSVTNRGEAAALGAQLKLDSGSSFDLGTLASGESTTVSIAQGSYQAQIFQALATVSCALPDAMPLDNSVQAVTRVVKADLPSSKQLVLGMTHLIAAPDGTRLYAAVAKSAGDIADGVAVINPETATVEAMLPVGANPQRLALSADGNQLYALLGDDTVVRWNRLTGSNEMFLTLSNEAVLDFVPLTNSPTSLVVATTERIVVFDGLQPRPAIFSNAVTRRYLGYASGLLWAAEPGQLQPFTIGAGGLAAGTPVTFTLFSDHYVFASDGRNLFFSGAVFDTVSRTTINNSFLGDNFCPDPANGRLFSPVGACLRGYALTNYAPLGEQCLVQASASYLQDPVRWGADGLAVRAGSQQLLMVHSPLVPVNSDCDVAVTIAPPAQAVPYQTNDWIITLTNRSATSASRVYLSASWGDIRDLQLEGPISWQSGASFVSDLGDLPGFSAVTYKIRGWCFQGNQGVSAAVLVANRDLNLADNAASASLYFDYPPTDFGIHSVTAPAKVNAGGEFEVTFIFTNAGPGIVNTTLLELIGNSAAEFLGVVGGAYPTNEYGPLLGAIGPAQSRTAVLRYRAKEAGLLPIGAYASGDATDLQSGNNRGGSLVFAATLDTNAIMSVWSVPGAILAWDASRQQVLAAFPDNFWTLYVLDPATLEPIRAIPLPGLPEFIAPCNDGQHAWVSLAGGSAALVDLSTGTAGPPFAYNASIGPVWAVAAVPGQTNQLLAAIDPGWLGNNRVQLFVNGVPRPATQGGLGWMGGGCSLVFTPNGRLFVASSQYLRELRIVANGLQEIANLDAFAEYDRNSITCTSNQLFFAGGRVVNLAANTASFPFAYVPHLAVDASTARAFLSPQYSAAGAIPLGCFETPGLNSLWQLPISLPYGVTALGSILPMGTNGVLLVAERLRLINAARLEPAAADLTTRLSAPTVIQLPGLDFPILLTVSNASPWTATATHLNVELSPGLVFSSGSAGAGTNFVTVDLGALNGATNLTLQARAASNGTFSVQAWTTSSLPDPVTTNNTAAAALVVLPPPLFLLDDTSMAEGSASRPASVTAWLSRVAPTNLNASFVVQLDSAQANDFTSLSNQFQFAAGQQKATLASLIKGDATPELDEAAHLVLTSTNLILARTSAVITLLNDDWPQVTVTNLTINEGNSGRSNAVLRATLSTTAPFPVEVFVRTIPGTASADVDFLSRESWLRFEPGENLKSLAVPVLGDTNYEPAETLALALLNQISGELLTAQATLTIRNDDSPPVPALSLTRLPDGSLRFNFDTVSAATYQLQSRTNLTNDPWQLVSGSVVGSGQPSSITLLPPGSPQKFYRLRAQ
jgi:hypothetical protein